MRVRFCLAFLIMALPCNLVAQEIVARASTMPQRDLGKWWKNSEVVRQLKIQESQISQIEQIFLSNQKMLASANEELKKREAQLRALMQAEPIQDAQAQQAIEQVAASRAKLEKISSSMMLSIRKVLSKEQWNKLSAMQPSQNVQAIGGAARPQAPEGLKQMDFMTEEPYAVGDRVNPPEILDMPRPSYTQAARDAKIQGIILLQSIVRKDGTAGSFKVIQGLGYGLDESAINTIANKWRFKPGTLNNKPVDVRVVIEVSFRLY